MLAELSGTAPRVETDPRFSSSPYEPELPPVTSLAEIDLLDPALYRRGDPHAAWRLLREQAPVFWHERPSRGTDDKGFWVLTRYDDIVEVYRDAGRYSSEAGPFLDLRVDDTPRRILPSIDGHAHRLRRSVVTRFFTPAAVNRWTETVRGTVNALLDEVAANGACDFSADIAQRLPTRATCDLIGISDAEAKSLVDMLFALEASSHTGLDGYNRATLGFFADLARERKNHAGSGSILDVVANAELAGEAMSEEDISHLLWVLFFGGIDSTVHALTGGMLALFHHPDQLRLLAERPELAGNASDEILRWTSTSHANKRQALQDVEIRGVPIRKGDYISIWSPSANRDATVFDDPFRFDLQRSFSRSHPIMTFGGGGPHQCMGQFFAKLEVKLMFEELVRRFPDITQAGPALRSDHFTILLSPLKSLPVRFTPG